MTDHDLTSRPKPIDDGECKVNHPLLWPNYSADRSALVRWGSAGFQEDERPYFRLVNYSNFDLPRIQTGLELGV